MGREAKPEWKPLRPNVLITGTPGTGKSTLSRLVAEQVGLRHISVGEFAKERNLLAEHDARLDFHYLHEDAVLDALEPIMKDGGVILDHHNCDWFPERWIQVVVVLRTCTEALYDRLEARQYPSEKVQENVQAEIFQVARDEAVESYPNVSLVELQSNTEEEQRVNVRKVRQAYVTVSEEGGNTGVVQR